MLRICRLPYVSTICMRTEPVADTEPRVPTIRLNADVGGDSRIPNNAETGNGTKECVSTSTSAKTGPACTRTQVGTGTSTGHPKGWCWQVHESECSIADSLSKDLTQVVFAWPSCKQTCEQP